MSCRCFARVLTSSSSALFHSPLQISVPSPFITNVRGIVTAARIPQPFMLQRSIIFSKASAGWRIAILLHARGWRANLLQLQQFHNARPLFSKEAFDNARRNEMFRKKRQTTLNYLIALGCAALGLSYAAVPMYKVFCQVTGIGGSSNLAKHGNDKVEKLKKVSDRKLRIIFNADTIASLHWKFKPVQREVTVYPGETALAFYTATNPTDRPIVGISTYTVLPFEAAKYLNKIQCFCFEEQRLNPHEQVDMPVFFYIDPEYDNDPWLEKNNTITLSYTFFEAKEGTKLPTNPFATWSAGKAAKQEQS